MTMHRRKFLLALSSATSGLILPRFYERAVAYLANHGEPLLEAPSRVGQVLNVYTDYGDHGGLFSFGHPLDGAPRLTWREAFERYLADEKDEIMEYYYLTPADLDSEADDELYMEHWYTKDSPYARAAWWLEDEGFGSYEAGDAAVGGIIFDTSSGMGGSATFKAFAKDANSVALLQHQINERNLGVKLVIS